IELQMLYAGSEQPQPVRAGKGGGIDFQPDGLRRGRQGEGLAVQRLKARALCLYLGETQAGRLVQQDRPAVIDSVRCDRSRKAQEQADDESCGDPEPAHGRVPSVYGCWIIARAQVQKAAMPTAFLAARAQVLQPKARARGGGAWLRPRRAC